MDEKAKRLRGKIIWCVALTFLMGFLGGAIGQYAGAPFYFGFFCGFVLAGLVSLFVLAAHLSGPPA